MKERQMFNIYIGPHTGYRTLAHRCLILFIFSFIFSYMRNDSVIPLWLYHGDEEAHEHKQLLFLYFFHFVSANLAHVALKEKHKGMKLTVRQCLTLTANTLSL